MTIDLTLDDHQLLLQRSANELFRKRYPSDVVRAIEAGGLGESAEGGRELAELGWLGISFPERYGGGGGRFLDLYPIYEEMGRFLVPSPHLDTIAVAGEIILAAGTDDQRQALLPEIAQGNCIISPAILEGDGSFGSDAILGSAEGRGGDLVIRETKLLVPYLHS